MPAGPRRALTVLHHLFNISIMLEWPGDLLVYRYLAHLVEREPRSHNQQFNMTRVLRVAHGDTTLVSAVSPWAMAATAQAQASTRQRDHRT